MTLSTKVQRGNKVKKSNGIKTTMSEAIKKVTCYYCGKAVRYKDHHVARGFVSHKNCPKREKKEREMAMEILREYKGSEAKYINTRSIYVRIEVTMARFGITWIYAKTLHEKAWNQYQVRTRWKN